MYASSSNFHINMIKLQYNILQKIFVKENLKIILDAYLCKLIMAQMKVLFQNFENYIDF